MTYGEICKFEIVFRGTGWEMQQNAMPLNDLFSTIDAECQCCCSACQPTLQLMQICGAPLDSVVSRADWPIGTVDFERVVWILVDWLIWKALPPGSESAELSGLSKRAWKETWSGCRSKTKLANQLAGDLKWLGQPATGFRGPKTGRCSVHCKGGSGSDIYPVLVVVVSTERTSVAFPHKHVLVEELSHCFGRGWKS